jgi:hypothetical protein
MSDLSDARLNPRTNAVAWRVMDPETHTIAEFDFCPGQYGFQLQDSVQQTTLTLTENVTGGTEFELVLTAPNVGQCYVNYANGICVFNVADLGKEVNSNAYNGGGSNANIVNLGLLASFSGKTTDDLDEGVTNLYANATSIPAIINAAAAKTTPVDADIVGIGDSAASFGLKKLTFANLFLWIVTKIFGLTGKTTPVDADQLLITDSAASNVGKSLTWANLKATLKTYFDTLYTSIPTYITSQATPSRVTGSAPTALGQYRSYLRQAGARTYTETNGTPATAPDSTNGYKLYTSADFATGDASGEPSRYEIYIGTGKRPWYEFYAGTGRTGYIGTMPFQRHAGNDVNGGWEREYDPTTGILRISQPPYQGGNNYTGIDALGVTVTADIYCDIKC